MTARTAPKWTSDPKAAHVWATLASAQNHADRYAATVVSRTEVVPDGR